jgi:hypothetical protein
MMKKEALINWLQHFRSGVSFKHTSEFPMLRRAIACFMACLFVCIFQRPLTAQEQGLQLWAPE